FIIDESKSNVLVLNSNSLNFYKEKTKLYEPSYNDKRTSTEKVVETTKSNFGSILTSIFRNSFELLCNNGPICKETMVGIELEIKQIQIKNFDFDKIKKIEETENRQRMVSILLKSYYEYLRDKGLRLLQPFYNVVLLSVASELNKLNYVIEHNGGEIIKKVQKQLIFEVHCIVPVYQHAIFVKGNFAEFKICLEKQEGKQFRKYLFRR
ncbi:Elongation factor-like GTPase 1, variant 2, partial [Bonamia ostreae]